MNRNTFKFFFRPLARVLIPVALILSLSSALGFVPYPVPSIPTGQDYVNVVYIDPDGNNGSGTMEAPYNTLQGLTLQANTAYLIKRGTVLDEVVNKAWVDVFVGAYGEGDMPVLNRGIQIQGTSKNAVFRDLHITSAGNGSSSSANNVIDFTHTPRPSGITIAYCRIIGRDEGQGYPWYLISNGAHDLLFFHNEVAYCRNNGWWLNARNVRLIRNWFHNTNKDGESDTESSGDGIQSNSNLTNGYIAGNYIDKSNSMWKYALMLNLDGSSGGDPSENVRAEYNTIIAPKSGAGGAAVRWEPGIRAQFRRNLVSSLPNLVTPFDTYGNFAHEPWPFGIRDNHILRQQAGSIVAFNRTTLSSDNLIFSSFADYDEFLDSNQGIGLYGSDIDVSSFWSDPLADDESPGIPQAPQSIHAVALGGHYINLQWSGSPGADEYHVYRSVATQSFDRIDSITGYVFIDRDVELGTDYSYYVTAANPLGEGPSSATVQVAFSVPFSEWAGVTVGTSGWVDMDNRFGQFALGIRPWVFSTVFDNWIHVPESMITPDKFWFFIPNPLMSAEED